MVEKEKENLSVVPSPDPWQYEHLASLKLDHLLRVHLIMTSFSKAMLVTLTVPWVSLSLVLKVSSMTFWYLSLSKKCGEWAGCVNLYERSCLEKALLLVNLGDTLRRSSILGTIFPGVYIGSAAERRCIISKGRPSTSANVILLLFLGLSFAFNVWRGFGAPWNKQSWYTDNKKASKQSRDSNGDNKNPFHNILSLNSCCACWWKLEMNGLNTRRKAGNYCFQLRGWVWIRLTHCCGFNWVQMGAVLMC